MAAPPSGLPPPRPRPFRRRERRRGWLRAPVSLCSVRSAYSSVCPFSPRPRPRSASRPPPRRGVSWPGCSGAPYFPHRRPVEHKQRGRGVPPAYASGQECCVLRQGLQGAETEHARSTMQGVLRCAEGHAVSRVLPSGALGDSDAMVTPTGRLSSIPVAPPFSLI